MACTFSESLTEVASAIATELQKKQGVYGIDGTTVDKTKLSSELTTYLTTTYKQLDSSQISQLVNSIVAKIETDFAKFKAEVAKKDPCAEKDLLSGWILTILEECQEKGGTTTGVPNDIRESVAIANVKTVAEQPAMLSSLSFSNLITNDNLSQQNAVSFQQSMNQLGITVTAKGVNRVSNLSPLESISVTEVMTSNDVAKDIAELRAVTVKAGGTSGGTP